MKRTPLFLSCLLLLGACAAEHETFEIWRDPAGGLHPRPTEEGMDEEEEERGHEARERYIEELHRAPRDVDWRAIERANQERELARRQQMALHPLLETQRWTEVGSRNQAGRVHIAALGAASGSSSKLYAGTDLGGLWRGEQDGTGWEPLSDDLFGGVQHIVVAPGEFTGDPDLLLVATDGGSVHVSRDDGHVWETPAGLPALNAVRGVAQLADAQHTLLVFGNTTGLPRLYASTDHGHSFQLRWSGPSAYSGGMWVPRLGAGAIANVYLVLNGRLYSSVNGGVSFTAGATIDASADRALLVGCEAGAPTLYAALRSGGAWSLYRSSNGGASFTFASAISDFNESIDCSSLDPNRVVYGGLEVWRTTNGGASFTRFNTWGEYYGNPLHKLHADCFGIRIVPITDLGISDERWYIGTDGGLFVSPDLGTSVTNLSLWGLGISQYYSTLTSRTSPQLILAGSQDQGYQRGAWSSGSGGPSTDFAQLISGDYGHLTSSDGTHGLVYCTYPGFILVQQGETNPQLLSPFLDFPAGSNHLWLPPVVADPLDPASFFFLGDQLWRYTRVSGPTWNYVQHTGFNFLASGGSYLSALAFAPSNAQRCYAVNNVGKLFSSSNHGTNWTQSSSSGPSSHYFYGNSLAVHPTQPLEAAVGGSGYGTNGVWRTTDGGSTWSALGSGLPQTMVYDLAYAENGSGDLYAATESGPWHWERVSNTWHALSQLGSPMTVYWSVESVDYGQTMRFGTYGRGIWDYAIPAGFGPVWSSWGQVLPPPHVLALNSAQLPQIGQQVALDVQSTQAAERWGWVLWSASPGAQPLFGGKLLLANIQNFTRLHLDASGHGSVRFRFPNDFALIDQSLYFQALVVDPSQVQGYAFSNGLQAVMGP
ncbi:MAG: hypothetical protein IPJ19_20740 [Planctomycetes bacterium]|nr:hypothetical protein [Planctomycetota bacterium]